MACLGHQDAYDVLGPLDILEDLVHRATFDDLVLRDISADLCRRSAWAALVHQHDAEDHDRQDVGADHREIGLCDPGLGNPALGHDHPKLGFCGHLVDPIGHALEVGSGRIGVCLLVSLVLHDLEIAMILVVDDQALSGQLVRPALILELVRPLLPSPMHTPPFGLFSRLEQDRLSPTMIEATLSFRVENPLGISEFLVAVQCSHYHPGQTNHNH